MSAPEIDALSLQPCCHRELKAIKRKMKLGRILQSTLAASPFALLMGSSPPSTAYSIATTDWSLWASAVRSVRPIVKNRCRQIAGLHVLDHPGGDLNRFWRAMYDHFA